MKNKMVLGFAFDTKHENVALIRKNRPDWQRGRCNGIGGHIEYEEGSEEAMVREFKEETGKDTSEYSWNMFCRMGDGDLRLDIEDNDGTWVVDVFCLELELLAELTSMTDEEIVIVPLETLKAKNLNIISNLSWLIPMALNYLEKKEFGVVLVPYE
jgi:8-oxo-dGTP pyrophosphatase MutT (NUDIX family)